jgi:hypothetical protein
MRLGSLLVIFACVFESCNRTPSKTDTAQSNSSTAPMDKKLIDLVHLFSEDSGERGRDAFQEMRSRKNIVDELVALRGRVEPNDRLQPEIAFALLKLGHQYDANAAIVSSALSKDPKFKNFASDQAALLLVRLIHDGDANRLGDLLRSADWADGALAQIIGDEASDQLLNDTTRFLEVLSEEPQASRMKIYGMIHGSDSLDQAEKNLIKTRLQSIDAKSPLFAVAQELRTSSALLGLPAPLRTINSRTYGRRSLTTHHPPILIQDDSLRRSRSIEFKRGNIVTNTSKGV